jgi:riboflavin biosynthesis pyrimidine reductase
MLQISPAPEKVLSDSELLNLYPWPNKPWIRANMVQSLDGSVTDQNKNTISLSTDSDKQIFRLLRQLSEVILVGSRTAQSAPYLDIKINEQNKELRKKLMVISHRAHWQRFIRTMVKRSRHGWSTFPSCFSRTGAYD